MLICLNTGNHSSPYVTARSLVRDLAHPRSIAMAKKCIQKCINDHPKCKAAAGTGMTPIPIVPTRLIDCGTSVLTDEFLIRIVRTTITKSLETGVDNLAPVQYDYAALSYVWGKPQNSNKDMEISPCSTTKNIKDRMSSGVKMRFLPATIRDAITVTRGLGLRWLWVDAMCILQDSKEDKMNELPKMRSLYRNSYITITAASASGSEEGFLHTRKPGSHINDSVIPFITSEQGTTKVVRGKIYLSPVWTQYDESQEPINTRAWCLQERMLPTRTLVFASHTLQYRCNTETSNIGNGLCAISSSPAGPDLAPLLLSGHRGSTEAGTLNEQKLSSCWASVVTEYTARNLTVSSDKLNAVAGMAELFYLTFSSPSRYLAGIWDIRSGGLPTDSSLVAFIKGLLWFKDYNNLYTRPDQYRAPSWSWASVNGRVILESIDDRINPDRAAMHEETVEACCEVDDCSTELVDTRVMFGEVRDGVLKIRAVAVEVGIIVSNNYSKIQIPEMVWEGKVVGTAFWDAEEKRDDEERVTAVPLLCNRKAGYAEGVLLAHVGDRKWRRIGYFNSAEDSTAVVDWLDHIEVNNITVV